MKKARILEKLSAAIEKKSAELVEDAVTSLHQSGYDFDFVPYLIQLLEVHWHYRHEDIASALQWTKDNRATPYLLKTAKRKFDYLDYDNSYPLARKCTWALADMRTEESKQALIELTQWEDDTIAGYAQKRLDYWEQEKSRKP